MIIAKVGKTIKSDYGVTFGGITLNLEENIVFGDASSGTNKLFKLKAFTPRDPTASYQTQLMMSHHAHWAT